MCLALSLGDNLINPWQRHRTKMPESRADNFKHNNFARYEDSPTCDNEQTTHMMTSRHDEYNTKT